MNKNIGKIKEQLDELGREYMNASAAKKQDILVRTADVISPLCGNETKYRKDKSFTIGEMYDSMVDLIFAQGESVFEKYSKTEKTDKRFSGYLLISAENRLTDKYRKEHPVTKPKMSEDDKEERMRFLPLESENTDGETIYFPDILNNGEDMVIKEYEQHNVCKHITDNKLHDELKKSEMTLIRSINIDFADHIQMQPCRSIEEFEKIPYKLRKYFGIAQSSEKELEVPFDAKVYITFYEWILHESISNALISRKRKEFEALLNSFLSGFIVSV